MSEEGNKLVNIAPGELNLLVKNKSNVYDYEAGDSFDRIRRVVNGYYNDANKMTHHGTWKAICLFSTVEYFEEGSRAPGFYFSTDLNRPMGMVTVIARIPELDVMKPWPKKFTNNVTDLDKDDLNWLSLHRVFRMSLRGRYGISDIPSPGDIVEVDFEDRVEKRGNIYVGLVEKGVGIIPDRPENDTGNQGEAQQVFNSPGAQVSTNSVYTEKEQQAISQSQQMQQEANDAIDSMVQAMVDDTGMNPVIARGFVEHALEGGDIEEYYGQPLMSD
tara:strand:+ start:78 stop:899 length:822 start_codon:yes stop_codon:yes gene_type:complete